MAQAIHDWLRLVLQRVEPWMSPQIHAGAEWRRQVSDKLKSNGVGIICVTPENQTSPWLLFEAGALSKSMNEGRVCPVLAPGMEIVELLEPLSSFQAKRAVREDILELAQSLNSLLGTNAVPKEILQTLCDTFWPKLEQDLNKLPTVAKRTPPRGVDDKVDEILELVRSLSRHGRDSTEDEVLRLWTILQSGGLPLSDQVFLNLLAPPQGTEFSQARQESAVRRQAAVLRAREKARMSGQAVEDGKDDPKKE